MPEQRTTDSPRIIEPTIEDLVALYPQLEDVVAQYTSEFGIVATTTEKFAIMLTDHIVRLNKRVSFMMNGGILRGLMSGVISSDPLTGEKVALQTILFTYPDCRGHACTLLSDFEKWAKSCECDVVYFHTGPDDENYGRREKVLARLGYSLAVRCYSKEI